MKKVLIGIQARLTSKRLPRKIFETIGRTDMLGHVVTTVSKSAAFMNRFSHKTGCRVSCCLLIPEGQQEIRDKYCNIIPTYEGSEGDVFSRYYDAMIMTESDWVCRITADCPLLPAYLISRHVRIATEEPGFDVVENTDPQYRTAPDGWDVQVLSRKAMNWLNAHNTTAADKEHVTSKIIECRPKDFKYAHVASYLDFSEIKVSVDDSADLGRVRDIYDNMRDKTHSDNEIMIFRA